MNLFLRFPDFKEKAVTFSYDDGTLFDEKLIDIFIKNGCKGTFNLNSGLFGVHRRLSEEKVKNLYKNNGMEIAVHGYKHLFLRDIPLSEVYKEIFQDKLALEELTGDIIRGSAYANNLYNDDIVNIFRNLGIKYARTCNDTHNFSLPDNWLLWGGTCHHTYSGLSDLLDNFLKLSPDNAYYKKPLLFYLWGHSYEFNDNDNWNIIEDFCEKVGKDDSIWKATNIEIYNYVEAYRHLEFSADVKKVLNNSNIDIYLYSDGKKVIAKKNSVTSI